MNDLCVDHHPSPVLPVLRADTLADSVIILLTMTAVQRLIGFCRAVLFCRWLEPEQLGLWDMGQGFLLLAAPLAVIAIPGAFGRYVEHFRQQGHLRVFLQRTVLTCGSAVLLVTLLLQLASEWFSQLVFGTPDEQGLVMLLGLSLIAVVSYNFLIELFTALRNVRLVSVMQLGNSLAFAVIGIGLLLVWQCTASSIVIAYGVSCMATAAIAVASLWRLYQDLPHAAERLSHRVLWSKMMPFAGWVLLTAVLVNLFEIVDRSMIIHCGSLSANDALAQVGNYHSSRVMPMLLVSIAMMLSTMITPHLSHDWEAGRRDEVAARLRLFLKLFGFGLAIAGVIQMLAAPLLFDVALQGKFAGGVAVLPWTLTYCTWFSLILVMQNFLWCAEKARLSTVALAIGLAANVALNYLWLPRFGLLGAVLATSAANLIALVLVCIFCRRFGFQFDCGTWVVLAVPAAFCLGPWPTLLVLVVLVAAAFSDSLLSRDERCRIAQGCHNYLERLLSRRTLTVLRRRRAMIPLADRGPLRVMFVITSMPVGGAETLLVEIIRRLDPERFAPELCCLKSLGPLGHVMATQVPAFSGLLSHKYDFAVLGRLTRLLWDRRIDAVVTVGTGGDKMFWGRLAAWRAGVPVICSALHSTGMPDRVEMLNRMLSPITDAFIAVAEPHGRYLADCEGCPAIKVRVIPNGVDCDRFHPRWPSQLLLESLSLSSQSPVVGIVAALRPEKHHELFLRAAALIREQMPQTRLLIVGDGPQRATLETLAGQLALLDSVHFLGTRSDIPDVLSLVHVLVLTSHMEANPISILEAMACEKPVVATRVGSVPETVIDGQTGYLTEPGSAAEIADRVLELLRDPQRAAAMGRAGREQVLAHWSIERTVTGYQDLLAGIYSTKCETARHRHPNGPADVSTPASAKNRR